MALAVADRVKETSTTAGTGTLTLLGAVSGYQSFSVIGSGNTTYYCIVDDNTGQWEVGVGTYTSPNQLSRDTVLSSSSGGSAITFLGNIKQVFVTYPAERSVYENAAGSLVLSKVEATTGIITNLTSTSAVLTNVSATSATVTNLTLTSLTISSLSITNLSAASATITTGNLTFSSTAQRITGDFSNGTFSNRLSFQSSTTNGVTGVQALPNGTNQTATFDVYNAADPTNASFGQLQINSGDVRVVSNIRGTGTYLPMTFYTSGSERMRLDTSGNLGIGTASPQSKLNVVESSSSTSIGGSTAVLQVGNSYGAALNVSAGIELFGSGAPSSGLNNRSAGLYGVYEAYNAGGNAGALVLATNPAGTTSVVERMRIDSSGNVGIGTTPNATLTPRLQVSSAFSAATASTPYNGVFVESSDAQAADKGGVISLGGLYDASSGPTRFAAIAGLKENGTSGNYAGYLAFYSRANGSSPAERMRIDSSGNVGIGGTANAFSKLEIMGTLPSSGGATVASRISGTFPSSTTSNAYAFATIIKTATASYTLTNMYHFSAYQDTLGAGSTVTNQYGYFVDATLTGATNNYGFFSNIASGSNRWNFYAAGTANNYFAGNVGIGTASLATKLDVAGSQVANRGVVQILDNVTAQTTGTGAGITLGGFYSTTQTTPGVQIKAAKTNATSGNYSFDMAFLLYQNGDANMTERMRIDSSGNVGIGTTSPSFKFEVQQGSSGATPSLRQTPQIVLKGYGGSSSYHSGIGFSMFEHTNGYWGSGILEIDDSGSYGAAMAFYTSTGSATPTPSERMRITSGGEVYIAGTTDQGAYNLQCNGTGVWGAGAYVNGSDAQLKDNIQSLDSGLDVVKAMRPVTFQYKPEYSKDQSVQPGFIAQELKEAMAGKPYLDGVVQEGTNHLNVAYQNIIPILVKAIQELEAKVAALEAK